MPGLSPGKSIPVGLPKPNRVIHFASRSGRASRAIVTAPTFDECARICATVSVSVPRGSASWTRPVGDLDRVRQRERRARRDEPVGERARDRDELEGRARLVGVGAPRGSRCSPRRHAREVVRVVARAAPPSRARRRCAGRARSRSRVFASHCAHRLAQHSFRVRLDRVVERQEDVVPLPLRRRADARRSRARTGRGRSSPSRACRRASCRARARARRGRGCRRPRSRAPAPRRRPAGTCAAPRGRSRARRCPSSASAAAFAGSAKRST